MKHGKLTEEEMAMAMLEDPKLHACRFAATVAVSAGVLYVISKPQDRQDAIPSAVLWTGIGVLLGRMGL